MYVRLLVIKLVAVLYPPLLRTALLMNVLKLEVWKSTGGTLNKILYNKPMLAFLAGLFMRDKLVFPPRKLQFSTQNHMEIKQNKTSRNSNSWLVSGSTGGGRDRERKERITDHVDKVNKTWIVQMCDTINLIYDVHRRIDWKTTTQFETNLQ